MYYSSIAGLGGFMVPFLMSKYDNYEQLAVSILAIFVAQLIWLLPATLNKPLPGTVEEAEALQTRKNKCCAI